MRPSRRRTTRLTPAQRSPRSPRSPWPGRRTARRAVLAAPLAAAAALGTFQAAPALAAPAPVDVQLLSITDFHGYLQPYNDAANGQVQLPDGTKLSVGGAAYNAAHLKRLSAGRANSILFSAGDNFSGWPFEVDAFGDEPTVEVLNKLGVRFSTVGNHELDVSPSYLKDHMMKGRCAGFGQRDVDTCYTDSTGRRFHGADFPFSTGNIVDARTGKPILKPYTIEWVRGANGRRLPVGFINLTVPDAPVGSTSYQPGLRSLPLLETANRYAAELRRRGVRAIVANVHDGGTAAGGFNACVNPTGPVVDFARQASPDIDAIVTGHWHAGFNCSLPDPAGNPRPVIEGLNHGRLISEIDLRLDPRSGEVDRSATTAVNHPVTRDIAPDPEVKRIADYWTDRGNRRAAEPLAAQTGDLTRAANAHGESTLGDLAADVQLWEAGQNRSGRADLALVAAKPATGSTPLAADLPFAKGTSPGDADGRITYGEAWRAYGYGNPILTVGLTGEKIHQALEQQWQKGGFAPLAVSGNVRYRYDASRPEGDRVDAKDVLIDGRPLDPARTYRVAALAYTLIGADGYPALTGFTDPYRNARPDHEAFVAYLRAHSVLTPAPLDRVTG
ncbi:bifunctional metallophosphatase/5'-nucleotidase [Actinomadura harenae]|uniref:Bifunctional metallophosphatase/5'-nucleotidase n=1 Tax=Actinomadura harenae TaxID=2483351 RepID=A0A3M2MDP4_9ACTN|nr:bifunctional UDP-sugar hydrolase/5'-nucleotidase [Actinomadura harenae]RMI47090.1 bifunctional metallophosphatase/5'-nucleotidase [Actinomadura harenae]